MIKPRRPRAILLLAVAAVSISLSGCAVGDAPEQASPSSAPAEQAAEPTPAASAEAAVVPTDCARLVAPEVYDAIFLGTPLNDPAVVDTYPVGVLTPTEPRADSTPAEAVESAAALRCVWRDPGADVTYLQVEIAAVAPETAEAHLASLPGLGYSCAADLGGFRCQIVGTSPLYPVEESTTVFVRDEVVVTVEQANFPTTNLLAEIVGGIWAS